MIRTLLLAAIVAVASAAPAHGRIHNPNSYLPNNRNFLPQPAPVTQPAYQRGYQRYNRGQQRYQGYRSQPRIPWWWNAVR